MTTKEYLAELEKDVKKMEIREAIEDDPFKKASMQKRIAKRSKVLKALRKLWDKKDIEYATHESD